MSKTANKHQAGWSLRVNDMVSYLRKRNWRQAPVRPNKHVLVFLGPTDDTGKPLTLVLPAKDEYQDTRRRLEEVVRLLALIEDREPASVANSIMFADRDILNARILGGSVRSDSIPLVLATRFLTDFKYMISCAARLEEKPEPYYAKISKQAESLARRCRFGQTFEGSFGFRIEIPIPASPRDEEIADASLSQIPLFAIDELQSDTKATVPLERRVTIRLIRGLKMIADSVSNDEVDILIQKYGEGFNGNIYESLQNIYNDYADIELGCSVSWSPEWPVDEDVKDIGEVSLNVESYRYIETAANELRKVLRPQKTFISGPVVQLKAEDMNLGDEDQGSSDCTVVIRDDSYSKRSIRVQVQLNIEDYKKACDAHKQGHKVRVNGELHKPGKFWTLLAPSDFQVEVT